MADHLTSKTAATRSTTTGAAAVLAIGAHQIHHVTDDLVTVMYPAGQTTVLSVQPDGTLETRPAGAQGPYELALLKVDRLVYAPVGAAGPVYLLPFAEEIPNV